MKKHDYQTCLRLPIVLKDEMTTDNYRLLCPRCPPTRVPLYRAPWDGSEDGQYIPEEPYWL
jgi:hypothetical protein